MSDNGLDIRYVARLARLKLDPAEEATFAPQLAQVLQHAEQLGRLDTAGVEPMAHPFPLSNVTRPDAVEPGLSREQALANAPAQANGLFQVPRIVE